MAGWWGVQGEGFGSEGCNGRGLVVRDYIYDVVSIRLTKESLSDTVPIVRVDAGDGTRGCWCKGQSSGVELRVVSKGAKAKNDA